MRRTVLLLALFLLIPLAGRGKERAAAPLPAIRLDEGLLIGACGQKPQGPGPPALRSDEPCLETLLRLVHVSGRHRVRFLYYDPAGNLYAATKPDWTIQPAGSGGYHKNAWVRHRLPIAGERAALLPGVWKAAAWLDGLTVSELRFRIERPAALVPPELAEARRLYLELDYERALPALEALARGEQPAAVRAGALWWLALCQNALGHDPAAALGALLALTPDFAVEPAEAQEAGAEGVAARLEELRARARPQLYRQSVAPPELELSKAEAPPQARRRWYQRWWLYAAAAAVAIPATALLADGGEQIDVIPFGPPRFELEIRHRPEVLELCEGPVSVQLKVLEGQPPFEAVFTMGLVASTAGSAVEVVGVTGSLGSADLVVHGQSFAQGPLDVVLPAVYMQARGHPVALLRFGAVLRDAGTASGLGAAPVGSPLPQAIRDRVSTDPRVVQVTVVDSLGRSAGCR